MPLSKEVLKQRQHELIKLFNSAPIKQTTGMNLSYDENGSAIFEMPYNPSLNNGLGIIHGGVISILLDNAGWFTVAPHFDKWVATAELQARLLEPVEKIDLYSKGFILRAGKRIVMAQMEVRTKDEKLIAVGSGTFVVTSVQMPKAKD